MIDFPIVGLCFVSLILNLLGLHLYESCVEHYSLIILYGYMSVERVFKVYFHCVPSSFYV